MCENLNSFALELLNSLSEASSLGTRQPCVKCHTQVSLYWKNKPGVVISENVLRAS